MLFALCCTSAPAQQNNTTSETQAADKVLREKAYELLDSLADQIGLLQSPENRARLASNLAASLWTHDERRARSLMVSVENDIRTGLQSVEGDDFRDNQTRGVFLQLRVDTVERIAKYDADLALAFFKATSITSDQPRKDSGTDMERRLELRLANQIAAESPEVALKLGRQSLARGFSHDLLSLLLRLNKKHKEQSLVFYKEIVAKLRQSNPTRYSESFYFGHQLIRSFKPPRADDLTFRELVGLFIKIALDNGCENKMDQDERRANLCRDLGQLVPDMEKVDPIRAAQLKQWAPVPLDQDWSSFNTEINSLTEEGTIDDVLNLSSKYPQVTTQIYWQAMIKALQSGDPERARKIANDYNGDPNLRQRMLADPDRREKWTARNEEQLVDVQRTLLTLPRIQDRIQLLFTAANRIGANDRRASLKLLDQASGMIDTMKPGSQQTEAQIALAMMYCMENSDRGLAIMEPLLPKLNELVAAAAKLDGYETSNLRDGEWNMSGTGSVGNLLSGLAQNARYFAWCDFDRAVSLTGQFERPEIRLMAQLKLAQAILAARPKRSVVPLPRNVIYR